MATSRAALQPLTVGDGALRVCRVWGAVRCALIVLVTTLPTGCSVPARAPVWLADGSGIVADDLYYDMATGTAHLLLRPAAFTDSMPYDQCVDAPRRRVLYSQLDYIEKASHIRVESVPLPNTTGERLSATIRCERDFVSDTYPLADLSPSPDGESVLLCTGEEAVIYHWSRKAIVRVPRILPPVGFARIFGVSPCVPTGAGFLAGMRGDGDDAQTSLVLVAWDGTVKPFAMSGPVLARVRMLGHIQTPKAAHRFLGTAAWNGPSLTLEYGGDRLEVDTDRMQVRSTAGDTLKENVTEQFDLALLERTRRSVELQGGRFSVVVRPQGAIQPSTIKPFQKTAGSEVVVRNLRDGTERLLDFSDTFPEAGFELLPSPDRRHVLVQCWAPELLIPSTGRTAYSLLIDADGKVETILGRGREQWESDFTERRYGRFHLSDYKKFGMGYDWHLPSADRRAEFVTSLGNASGPLAKLRQSDYIDLRSIQPEETAESVHILASFPNLRYLGCDPDREVAEAIGTLPGLEGIVGDFTDDFLRSLPVLPKLQRVHIDLESTITTDGLRSLQKHPQIEELYLERFRPTLAFAELGGFPKLERLLVRSEYTDSPRLTGLAEAQHLRSLTVISREINADDLAEIGRITSLQRATLSGLSKAVETLDPLSSLKGVTHLVLYRSAADHFTKGSPLRPCPLRPLGALEELQCLTLSGIPFDREQAAAIASLPKLQSIRLYVSKTSSDEEVRKASMVLPRAAVEIRQGDRRVIYCNGKLIAESRDR